MINNSQIATILFLDIDGVLNTFEYEDIRYDQLSNSLIDKDIPLNSKCILNLKRIIDNIPDLKIVWSTNWAMYDQDIWHKWRNPRHYLELQPWFSNRLIGRTPRKMSSERHDEIILWLEGNKRGYNECAPNIIVRNFVALDDVEYGMHLIGQHYFKTTYNSGLTSEITDNVIKFLQTDMKWISLTD